MQVESKASGLSTVTIRLEYHSSRINLSAPTHQVGEHLLYEVYHVP
jgi:hypothetical protein